nr:DUF4417 domain-containing protein [Bifidobacterium cuniculi]
MIDWNNRLQSKNPQDTVITMFMNDDSLYRRLFRLSSDLPEYKRFMGVSGFDFSPRPDMPLEMQQFHILVNMLATLWLGIHGVPIVPNWRIGSEETLSALTSYPADTQFAVGTLGCARRHISTNITLLCQKLIVTQPKSLLVYGALRPQFQAVLEQEHIDFRVYREYRYRSFHAARKDTGAK